MHWAYDSASDFERYGDKTGAALVELDAKVAISGQSAVRLGSGTSRYGRSRYVEKWVWCALDRGRSFRV